MLGISHGSYSGPPASLGPLPDVCPDDPRKLPEALFRHSYPEATEPPVACEVQERLIEAIVAKAPARRTHTSVAAPMVAMAPRAGGGGEGGRLAAALARRLHCMNLLCVLFAAATSKLQARRQRSTPFARRSLFRGSRREFPPAATARRCAVARVGPTVSDKPSDRPTVRPRGPGRFCHLRPSPSRPRQRHM